MTDRQARRIELLLRLQCMEQQNIFTTLVGILVAMSKDPAKEATSAEEYVTGWKKLVTDALNGMAKDAAAEVARQQETKETKEAIEQLLKKMDEQLKQKPGLGFKP